MRDTREEGESSRWAGSRRHGLLISSSRSFAEPVWHSPDRLFIGSPGKRLRSQRLTKKEASFASDRGVLKEFQPFCDPVADLARIDLQQERKRWQGLPLKSQLHSLGWSDNESSGTDLLGPIENPHRVAQCIVLHKDLFLLS